MSAPAADTGIFDRRQAGSLAGSDATHWWFASKATVVQAFIRQFAPDGVGPTIDVGAGGGGVTQRLTEDFPGTLAVEGSSELAQLCGARGLPSVQALTSALPVASSFAAAVTLLDVIEHLPDPFPTLHEVRRILQPGGLLIVTVPAHQWLWSAADEALGHVKRYNRRLLRSELDQAGFRVLWCTHVFSWLVAPVVATRKAAKKSAQEQLGLEVDGRFVGTAARILTSAELAVARRVGLPLGTTIAAVAVGK